MNGVSTITQKGQVVIPQPIRQLLGLEAFDRLYFETKKGKIIAQPVLSLDEALGMIKAEKFVSKKEYKRAIARRVVKKFSQP